MQSLVTDLRGLYLLPPGLQALSPVLHSCDSQEGSHSLSLEVPSSFSSNPSSKSCKSVGLRGGVCVVMERPPCPPQHTL